MTHIEDGPGPGRIICFAKKLCFWPKICFFPKKNTQNPLRRYFFVSTTLPGYGQNMVFIKKWTLFLGPKFCISTRKSVFCFRAPDFVNGLFVALGKTVDLAPSDRFFDKKFPPNPLWGHHLPVTALALLARRPFGLDICSMFLLDSNFEHLDLLGLYSNIGSILSNF